MNIKDLLKKQGGVKLIKQYAKNGVLFTSFFEFILLGKSRTGLELLREIIQLKIRNRLYRKYKKQICEFEKNYSDSGIHLNSKKIWICWFQGMENAPDIVKKCYQSVKENIKNREVVLITSDNMDQYVKFPNYIIEKWKKGIITNTHFTDLLRLELLVKYGGTWMDATVFVTGNSKSIPDYLLDSDLFFYQTLKPGRDGHAIFMSSWFMTARSNNKILMETQHLCYEYWKRNNYLEDYFLLHDFMSLLLERHHDEWNRVTPRDNGTPHILLLRLFEQYDEEKWQAIKDMTPFHKMTYKFDEEKANLPNTYYKRIFG